MVQLVTYRQQSCRWKNHLQDCFYRCITILWYNRAYHTCRHIHCTVPALNTNVFLKKIPLVPKEERHGKKAYEAEGEIRWISEQVRHLARNNTTPPVTIWRKYRRKMGSRLCLHFLLEIQWKPLIMITVGPAPFDNNNRLITLNGGVMTNVTVPL